MRQHRHSTVVPSSNTIRQFRFYNPATALSQYAYSGLRCFQITKTLTTIVERHIEQGLIARDGGGEVVRQRETRVSFQMRKEIAMRETLVKGVHE